ncbi:MAG: hypothetical protein CVU64_13980 [Deltaproteobacteria bacterium HGW-Deltaproteobacteria-21]|nr:MAG: hypothetical protein CVU64_13980 [Deltaproteobacteria bacterium HGW-Deltaproteobacteria-21]
MTINAGTAEEIHLNILDVVGDGLFTTDHTGLITFVNAALAEMFGLDGPEEMIGRHFSEFVSPEFRDEISHKFKKAVEEKSYSEVVEFCTVRKDGEIIFIQLKHGPVIRNGQVVGTAGVIRDVTDLKRAEKALAASEKKFRDLITNMQEVLYTLDRDGRVTFVSPSVESMAQYKESEIIGHRMEEFIFKDDLPRLYRDFQDFMAGRGETEHEYRLVTKNGEIRWMMTHSSLRYEGGEVIGIQGILSDITEHKRVEEELRESEEKFRSIVETTSDRVWETDAYGVYTFVSPRVRDLLGYEPEEFLGRRPFEFMPPEESARMKAKFSRIAKERKSFVDIENVNIARDGRRVVLETSGVPRLDEQGNLLGYRGIDRDITDRRVAEEGLRRSRDELELRVQERTAELERRNQELQNFTFSASHDLQEPLRKIQTFADLLATKYLDSVSERGRDYIKRVHETASRMRDVLQSLMKYSHLISRIEPFGRVDLNKIAREVVSDLELRIRDSGASVWIGDLPEIEADAGQMRQLFQNLLWNGLKFSRKGIQPRVKIHADCGSQEHECQIYFDDNGIGFDEMYVERIFKPFHRLHCKEDYDGVGMGLAICAKVVEHHKGSITAKSTPGKGSTFIVTLPVNQVKAISR